MIPLQRIIGPSTTTSSYQLVPKQQIPKEIASLRDEIEQALRNAGFTKEEIQVHVKFGCDAMPMVILSGRFPKQRLAEFEKAFQPFHGNPNIQCISAESEGHVGLYVAA